MKKTTVSRTTLPWQTLSSKQTEVLITKGSNDHVRLVILASSAIKRVISLENVLTMAAIAVAEVETASSAISQVTLLVNVLTDQRKWRTEAATNDNAETTTRAHSEARMMAGTRISQTSAIKTLKGSNRKAGTTKVQTVGGTTTEWGGIIKLLKFLLIKSFTTIMNFKFKLGMFSKVLLAAISAGAKAWSLPYLTPKNYEKGKILDVYVG